jgi:mRNA interferase MazF
VNRGEVWWVEGPTLGRRPYLLLTRDTAIGLLNAVIAVPATRTIRGIPTEVLLGGADGLPDECALTLDNVATIPKEYFRERICRLTGERMREVCSALMGATGCTP